MVQAELAVQIRQANKSDFSSFSKLRSEEYKSNPPLSMEAFSAFTQEKLHLEEDQSQAKQKKILLAEKENQVIGLLMLATGLPGYLEFLSMEKPLYIMDIVVDPAHRRKGIGCKLLNFALDLGRQMKTRIVLESAPKYLPWYFGYGFEKVEFQGEQKAEYDATGHSVLVLAHHS